MRDLTQTDSGHLLLSSLTHQNLFIIYVSFMHHFLPPPLTHTHDSVNTQIRIKTQFNKNYTLHFWLRNLSGIFDARLHVQEKSTFDARNPTGKMCSIFSRQFNETLPWSFIIHQRFNFGSKYRKNARNISSKYRNKLFQNI